MNQLLVIIFVIQIFGAFGYGLTYMSLIETRRQLIEAKVCCIYQKKVCP